MSYNACFHAVCLTGTVEILGPGRSMPGAGQVGGPQAVTAAALVFLLVLLLGFQLWILRNTFHTGEDRVGGCCWQLLMWRHGEITFGWQILGFLLEGEGVYVLARRGGGAVGGR